MKGDTDYVTELLNINDPNLNFTIHAYNQDAIKAKQAYQLATAGYLDYLKQNAEIPGNIYLNLFTDRRLKAYQNETWFQEALTLEKGKYDALLGQYPRALEILEK